MSSYYLTPDMEERAERQKERDGLAQDNLNQARDLRIKSLSHWALLSGGTLTLLVPFTQSLDKPLHLKILLISAIVLILALIINSLGLFVTSVQRYHWFLYLKGEKEKVWFWTPINDWIHPIGVMAYILGIVLAAVFVGFNIS